MEARWLDFYKDIQVHSQVGDLAVHACRRTCHQVGKSCKSSLPFSLASEALSSVCEVVHAALGARPVTVSRRRRASVGEAAWPWQVSRPVFVHGQSAETLSTAPGSPFNCRQHMHRTLG